MFDFQGEMLDIYSSTDKVVYRCLFDDETLTHIQVRDSQTFATKSMIQQVTIRPATQYVQDIGDIQIKLDQILRELAVRTSELEKAGKIIEAHRLQKRVEYDVRMIRET